MLNGWNRKVRMTTAMRSAHDPAGANACRLLVRPYLPVGVDHVLLIAGTDGFFELKRSRTRDPIFD